MTEDISCDCKCKFSSLACNSNEKWNNKTCQCHCKNYCMLKRNYSWNPSNCICENRKYLQSTLVNECDEIVFAIDIVLTKKTNVTSTH